MEGKREDAGWVSQIRRSVAGTSVKCNPSARYVVWHLMATLSTFVAIILRTKTCRPLTAVPGITSYEYTHT